MFQGGYGSVFGFSLGASFSTRNLGGGGETLSVSYNGGKYQKSFTVGYTEPYVFDLPYSFSASVNDSVTDYDASRVGEDNAYKEKSRGFGVSVGTRLSNFFPESVGLLHDLSRRLQPAPDPSSRAARTTSTATSAAC